MKNYIDDIVIHNTTWEDNLISLRTVFKKLKEAGLTAKPSKCTLADKQVEFLGHEIGSGVLSPKMDKFEVIKKAKQSHLKTRRG